MAADYISLVIVGKAEKHQAWRWETWTRMVPLLNPIVTATDSKVAVRSVQAADSDNRDVRFGRLGWDTKSHQKWTLGSVVTQTESAKRKFCFTEIWAPSYTVCERERSSPVLFIKIENPFIRLKPKNNQYNQFFHLAVPLWFLASNRIVIGQAIEAFSALLESVLLLVRIAPWNVRGDCVQDLLNNHLHYIGMFDDLIPNVSKMTGKWEEYQKGNLISPLDVWPHEV